MDCEGRALHVLLGEKIRIRNFIDFEPAFDNALQIIRYIRRDSILRTKEVLLNPLVCLKDAVQMWPPKPTLRLSKGLAEEAADTAIPSLNPRKDAATRGKHLSELFNMCINLLLIDDPVSGVRVEL